MKSTSNKDRNYYRKYSAETVKLVIESDKSGAQLSRELGISESMVSAIRLGQRRKNG